MNTLTQPFQSNKVFIAYLTAGHPDLSYTEKAACALVEGGVNILEIGIPFSDPMADGPTIQAAMHQALQAPIGYHAILHLIYKIKTRTQVPIVLFTYYNPLLAIGADKALCDAAKAGVDGILVVDLPIDESTTYLELCQKHAIEPICVISPSTDNNRIKTISKHCDSFLYYVCRNGTTGTKKTLPSNYATKIKTVQSVSEKLVVCGFGIGNQTTASQVLQHADGFVVGSAFVNAITEGASHYDLKNLAIKIDPR